MEFTNQTNKLYIYRVKKEFTTDGGRVTWPVGATRFWTAAECDLMRDSFTIGFPKENTLEFFQNHFEQVYPKP